VTSFTAAGARNDYGNFVGMKFTVGSTPMTVTALGRVCVPGNSGIHTLKLLNAATGVDVPGGSISVNMAGCTAGQFTYAALPGSVVLTANNSYFLASGETAGGDQWYNVGPITSTGAAAVNSAVYFDGANWIPIAGSNSSYVPPNLLYQ
jgi:hypothetical protein